MLRKLFAGVLIAATVMGCTTVSNIRGPDGEDAYVVRCQLSESCYAKAEEVCDGRYVVHSTAIAGAGREGGGGTEVLVSCK